MRGRERVPDATCAGAGGGRGRGAHTGGGRGSEIPKERERPSGWQKVPDLQVWLAGRTLSTAAADVARIAREEVSFLTCGFARDAFWTA